MTTKQEDILRKVRGLYAKANSTDFEAEREAFMAKADQLMEAYAIETWQLETGEDAEKAKLIVRRDFDMQWFRDLDGIHWDARSNVWHLFMGCVRHCRCQTSVNLFSTSTIPVYGLQADLDYLDLLFTDLFIQLFAQLKPKYDENKSMGENIMVAKEAGMKYTDIAVWLGHPEWREMVYGDRGYGHWKTCDNGKMLREYKKYLKSIGKSPRDVVSAHPDAWAISFTQAFWLRVTNRLRNQVEQRESTNTGSMALVLRDIAQMALEALWADFPDLKPHPSDCPCKQCTGKRKPVKYRGGHRINEAAYARGGAAGDAARIVSNDPKLRTPGQIGR